MATGDPFDLANHRWFDGTYWPDPPLLPVTCNCACYRCLQGDCCLIPNRAYPWSPPTYVWTGTGIAVGVHEHSWQAVGLDSGDVIQSCSCGEVRRVPVP